MKVGFKIKLLLISFGILLALVSVGSLVVFNFYQEHQDITGTLRKQQFVYEKLNLMVSAGNYDGSKTGAVLCGPKVAALPIPEFCDLG